MKKKHPQESKLEEPQADNVISSIISAGNYFQRLLLDVQITPSAEIRLSFKKLALLVHPDKCKHEQATLAFQLLSKAFEVLYEQSSQEKYILSLQKEEKKTKVKKYKYQKPKPWNEVLLDIIRKEKEEENLRKSFVINEKLKYSHRKTLKDLEIASRVCEDLDSRFGITNGDFWNIDISSIEDHTKKLIEILNYLRSTYCYCIYCGVEYSNYFDLSNYCPGIEHEC